MAKYEIIIKNDGQEKHISAESINMISYVIPKGEITILCSGAYHSGGTVAKPKEPYSRAQVLREEWQPVGGYYGLRDAKIFRITPSNQIYNIGYHEWTQWRACKDSVYTPTFELAEEIIQIRLGKWLPRSGDKICACQKNDYSHSWTERDSLNDFRADPEIHENNIYFPSVEQMLAFIEKNKPKEETKKLKSLVIAKSISITDSNEGYHISMDGKDIYMDESGFLKIR